MNSQAERSCFLGASDSAGAAGLSRYQQPLELWLEKTGAVPPEPENDDMLRGKLMEPVVLALFTRRTGHRVLNQQQRRFHPDIPWMACTLDGETEMGELVEAKTCKWRMAHEYGEEGTDALPQEYVVQATHQLAVTGAKVVHVPVLIGGEELRLYRVERNERLIDGLIAAERRFWAMVESCTPPPPDWAHDTTPALINLLYKPMGGKIVLPVEALDYVATYCRARDEEKAAKQAKDVAKARLTLALGGASVGICPDGTTVRRTPIDVREYTVAARTQVRLTVTKPKGARSPAKVFAGDIEETFGIEMVNGEGPA